MEILYTYYIQRVRYLAEIEFSKTWRWFELVDFIQWKIWFRGFFFFIKFCYVKPRYAPFVYKKQEPRVRTKMSTNRETV